MRADTMIIWDFEMAKTVLITAGASGIGSAMANQFDGYGLDN